MNMPGFTAEASLGRGMERYKPECFSRQRNSAVGYQVTAQMKVPDPTAVHGNCCGYSRKCNESSETVDAVDEACKQHDICVDSTVEFLKCDCHMQFIRDLASAWSDPSTSQWAKNKALVLNGLIWGMPCLCRKKVCVLGLGCVTTRIPSAVGACLGLSWDSLTGGGGGGPSPPTCATSSDCGPGRLCLGGECRTFSEPRCQRQSDCPPDSLCYEVRIVGSQRELLGRCDSAQYYSGTPRSKVMGSRPGDGGVWPPLKECRCIGV